MLYYEVTITTQRRTNYTNVFTLFIIGKQIIEFAFLTKKYSLCVE